MGKTKMLTRRSVFASAAVLALSTGVSAAKSDDDLATVFRMCAFDKSDGDHIKPIVRRFADKFACSMLGESERNPRCCVWFELIGEANPGGPGWIFLHNGDGSICYATDTTQLDKAVDALAELAIFRDGLHHLLVGVTTSFAVRQVVAHDRE